MTISQSAYRLVSGSVLLRGFAAAAALTLAVSAHPAIASPQQSKPQPTAARSAPQGGEASRPDLVKDTRSRLAPTTLGLVAGAPDLTEAAIAAELSRVLVSRQETGPNGELALRVLPIAGHGGLQNVRDVLTLPGVDMGIAPTVLLDRLRTSKELGEISRKLVYIAPLHVQEVHIVAGPGIQTLRDLAGQVVNLGEVDGTESLTRDLFSTLGIQARWVYLGHQEALEQIRRGEIAATVLLSGKSVSLLSGYKREDGFHFVPIDESVLAEKGYLPTRLTPADYPNLINPEERIDTVGVGSVLFAYNWPAGSSRHRLLADFVQMFFSQAEEFQKEARHPKWREVNLAASLSGWARFSAAEQWLERHIRPNPSVASPGPSDRSPETTGSISPTRVEDERLFQEFLRWREKERASQANR